MRTILALSSLALTAFFFSACTVDNTGSSSGTTGSSGTTSSSGGSTSGSTGSTSGGSSGATPPTSTKEGDVQIQTACAAFAGCGGSLAGAYDYAGGCAGDVFADARARCPGLDTSGAKSTVRGTLFFTGNALRRDIVSTVSGTIVFPVSCSQGQCAAVEGALQQAFPGAKCTGASSCTCTLSTVETTKNETTFATAGNTATTADGETFDYCVRGAALQYSGKTGTDPGVWNLTAR